MNTIDTILDGKFTNYNGMKFFGDKKKITTGNIKMLSEMFSRDELMDLIQGYKGEHYMELIHLAIKFNNFDIAMDIALANEDWDICKEINYELRKAKINNEQPERRNNRNERDMRNERDTRNERNDHNKFTINNPPSLFELFGGNLNQFGFGPPNSHEKNNHNSPMEDMLQKYKNLLNFNNNPSKERPTNSKDFEDMMRKMFPQNPNIDFFYIDERDDYGFEEDD